ncbi:MAG: hypothetical protein J5659_04625 [Clostridia bacterium]|nr:hypothetical protein [Clostridia bacterium]
MKLSDKQLQSIYQYEKRRGINYARTSGKLYKWIFAIGFLTWIFSLIMVLLYILGSYFSTSDNKNIWTGTYITILTAYIVTLSTPIFFGSGLKLTALFINLFTLPTLMIYFMNISAVDESISSPGSVISEYDPGFLGLKKMFFLRHGVPIFITIVMATWLIIIIFRERKILSNELKAIQNREYIKQFDI